MQSVASQYICKSGALYTECYFILLGKYFVYAMYYLQLIFHYVLCNLKKKSGDCIFNGTKMIHKIRLSVPCSHICTFLHINVVTSHSHICTFLHINVVTGHNVLQYHVRLENWPRNSQCTKVSMSWCLCMFSFVRYFLEFK